MTPGEKIVFEAFAAFDKWCREHDPDGDETYVDQVEAYGKWCDEQARLSQISTP
jgi:hypothetical protein